MRWRLELILHELLGAVWVGFCAFCVFSAFLYVLLPAPPQDIDTAPQVQFSEEGATVGSLVDELRDLSEKEAIPILPYRNETSKQVGDIVDAVFVALPKNGTVSGFVCGRSEDEEIRAWTTGVGRPVGFEIARDEVTSEEYAWVQSFCAGVLPSN